MRCMARYRWPAEFARVLHMFGQSTIFHITHHKAGSQWVAAVLKHCAPERFIQPQLSIGHFLSHPIRPGAVYPCVYAPRWLFELALLLNGCFDRHCLSAFRNLPSSSLDFKGFDISVHWRFYTFPFFINWLRFRLLQKPYRCFVVIRDPRDSLVSLYFSKKFSHPVFTQTLAEERKFLHSLSEEEGLLYLLHDGLDWLVEIALTWMDGPLVVRYEDLIMGEQAVFEQIVDYCEIAVSRRRLREIVHYNSFNAVTGRQMGYETGRDW